MQQIFFVDNGDHRIRPDREMGYRACCNATDTACPGGSIGAGTGATIGKIAGMQRAIKGGLGCYAVRKGELRIGALVAVKGHGTCGRFSR